MSTPGWIDLCAVDDLDYERGVAALVGERQVAVFRLLDGSVYAVDHRDPFSGAHVIARGIVGSRRVDGRDVPTVASPMYKQVFDLRTGRCLSPDDDPRHLASWQVRVDGGRLMLRAVPSCAAGAPVTAAATMER